MALSNHSIGILISRILGVYVFITLIGYFGGIGYYPPSVLIPVVLSLLSLSYVFLLHAPRVATFLMSGTSSSEHATSLTIGKITAAAFVIMGVWLLIRAVPEIVGALAARAFAELRGNILGSFARSIAELLLGLYLVFDAKGITLFIEKVRSGQPKV